MLKFSIFHFKTITLNSFSLPPYKGSTFRGAFGHTIKKIACVKNYSDCDECILKSKCIYSYIFETPPPENSSIMKKYTAAPHPFVIEPPIDKKTWYEKDDELNFSIILIGKGIDYLPYFIYAFEQMGQNGIGKDRGGVQILEVINSGVGENNGVTVYGKDKKLISPVHILDENVFEEEKDIKEITINFITPTRIKYEERLADRPEFHIFIRNILRRTGLLSYFHCNTNVEIEFKEMIERAKEVKMEICNLQWEDWERYSSRQNTKMKLGGFVGSVKFKGDLKEFMPFILSGQYIHLGKGAGFGLGKYEVG
jgi:CRISPR-associated endoribonuclease Cas6